MRGRLEEKARVRYSKEDALHRDNAMQLSQGDILHQATSESPKAVSVCEADNDTYYESEGCYRF